MSDTAKNLADVILDSLQLLAIIVGAGWAMWRLRRERTHVPRFEVGLVCNLFGPQGGHYVLEVIATMKNQGMVKHIVNNALLRVRGIPDQSELALLDGKGSRIAFPMSLIKDDMIFKAKYDHVFAEPGITQPLSYVGCVPANVRFLLARVEFRYDEGRSLSVERVIDVRGVATAEKS